MTASLVSHDFQASSLVTFLQYSLVAAQSHLKTLLTSSEGRNEILFTDSPLTLKNKSKLKEHRLQLHLSKMPINSK